MELEQSLRQIAPPLFALADDQHPKRSSFPLLPVAVAKLGISAAAVVLTVVDAFLREAFDCFGAFIQLKEEVVFKCIGNP
jgi:hypothetical protein